MKIKILATTLWTGAMCIAALAESAPRIQFEQTTYDFGNTSRVATVTGVFKFKNIGDGILKVEAPQPSCGCTIAELKPDTLAPGATGELSFTLHLGLVKAQFDKLIVIKSNDPKTPEVSLSVKADYTPLYEISPMVLAPQLAFGSNDATQVTTVTRTDGKPLRILKLDPSKSWIAAKVETSAKPDGNTARISVTVRRDGPPRRFNEFVHIYTADQTNSPAASIGIYGQMMGEVALNPEALYWSITDATNTTATRPEEMVMRRLTISSSGGKAIELRNPQSTIKGLKVEIVPKEPGKVYELHARLDEMPASTVSGNVSFETSVASQSRIEVPVIVNVSKP